MRLANLTYKAARRVVVTLVGGTVVAIGLVMIVFPGPATVVIPVGLAILGLEFAWARRLLRTVKEKGGEALDRVGVGQRLRSWWRGAAGPGPGPGGHDGVSGGGAAS